MTATAERSPLDTVRDAMTATLSLSEQDSVITDFIMSIIISNVWTPDADPLWGYIIGPPGSTKTEALRPISEHRVIHFLSSMTNASLVSGYDPDRSGEDMSLLPKLDRKILVIKDFTAILGLPSIMLQQIFADLRDAYDGQYAKAFGTVGERRYKVKFGLIAAVTPAIDRIAMSHVILGERFLSLRVNKSTSTSDRIETLLHARSAMSGKAVWRQSLTSIWTENLDKIIGRLPTEVDMLDRFNLELVHLADIVSNVRALPSFVKESERLSDFADPELGTRLVNQFANLALAHCVADGRTTVNERDMEFVRRIALDTLHPKAVDVVKCLYRNSTLCMQHIHINKLSKHTGIMIKKLRSILNQYRKAGIVECRSTAARVGYTAAIHAEWKLSDEFLQQVQISRVFSTDYRHPNDHG